MIPVERKTLHTVQFDPTSPELLRCEDEQIRIPGSVQTHGFLLLVDEKTATVVAASENAPAFLGIPLKLLLGASLETLLDREPVAALRALALSADPNRSLNYLGAFRINGELCSLVTHSVEGRRIIEFETLDRLVGPELMNAVITNFVSNLSKMASQAELCQAITRQIKDLTGYNRVLLYSFDEFGHGTVLNEENDGTLPSYLDLRFPAADIPPQARALYVQNTIRCIPDASYVPSPLKGVASVAAKDLDLSQSVLRSVSPIHLEYMRNMGTVASMSISIVYDGKLWGLISAHHSEPRSVPYLIRTACDLLTKLVCTQLKSLQTAAQLETKVTFQGVHHKILTQIASDKNYITALESQMDELMKVTNAGGVALLIEDHLRCAGNTPDIASLNRIAEWLDTHAAFETFDTRELGKDLPWATAVADRASGMLAIRISDVKRSYILWFRPEIVRTVKWAGDPVKVEDGPKRLHPRLSFASWQETVRGKSSRWSETEKESADDFRISILKIILKRSEEAALLSEARFHQLTQSIPTLVWTSNDDGDLTYVNQRWRENGLREEGAWFGAGNLVAEDAERCRKVWKRAVLGNLLFEEEVRLRIGTTKTERWNLIRAVPFERADGSRAGWVGTCTDLTDRRERETALRMTEKLALTGRMTSVIAHEINNPLESITNLLYLLRGSVEGDEDAEQYLTMAEMELERISGITKQTLRWSREDLQLSESVSAGNFFDDGIRLFAGKIRNRTVSVTIVGGEDLPVFGVAGQLRQVLANLISNALDAVPLGGEIRLEARGTATGTELLVTDEGSGMSGEMQTQIFQPFFSTKGDLGNGLGLYISQEIVERHGGTITVESQLGSGTTMRVYLPSPVIVLPAMGSMVAERLEGSPR